MYNNTWPQHIHYPHFYKATNMGLKKDILNQPIANLKLRDVAIVNTSATVHDAIIAMRNKKLGTVIITDDADLPLGMFNEKILIPLLVDRPNLLNEPATQHMTTKLSHVTTNDTIAHLVHMMQQHNLRWMLVLDDQGRPIAITGLLGVVTYVVEHFQRLIKVQPMQTKLSIDEREGA